MPDLKIDLSVYAYASLQLRRTRIAQTISAWLRHAEPEVARRSVYAYASLQLRRTRFALTISARLRHAEPVRAKRGGGRRTRTFEVIRRLIYSQAGRPDTTRQIRTSFMRKIP